MSNSDDVKRFAAFLRKKEADEQAERDAANDRVEQEKVKAEAARQLLVAKQAKTDAAARLRDLRKGRHTAEQLAEAEAAYRAALGTELELESGARPAWAPAPPAARPSGAAVLILGEVE